MRWRGLGSRSRDDAGDTLIEVLIAVVIIGLTAVPLMGMLLETIGGASEHRDLALIDTMLKSFAETAKSQLETSPPTAPGTLSGTKATSALFAGPVSYVGYGISGAGIPATTVITAETTTHHTATLSVAVTAGEVTDGEPLTIGYQAAAQSDSYHLMSDPSTLSGPSGTPVTVFVTGFHATPPIPLATFHVDIGPVVTLVPTPSPKSSGPDPNGNARITFTVPTLPPTHAYPIIVTARGDQVASLADFTVTATGTRLATPPDVGYTLGIAAVKCWTPRTETFTSPCTSTTAREGLQQLEVVATGPGHVSDHLTVTIRDPAYTAVPRQTPGVVVNGTNVARPTAGSTTLVFTATVTPSASDPLHPSQPVTWTVAYPNATRHPCASTSQATGAGNSETYTCKVQVTPSSTFGTYIATATYPGDAYDTPKSGSGSAGVYAPDGSGKMTVQPPSVTPSSPTTLTFTYTPAAFTTNGTTKTPGTKAGEVTITVPTGWTAPQATPAKKATAGFCSAAGGTGSDSVVIGSTSRLIEVTGVTLTAGQTLTITYAKASVAAGTASPSHFPSAETSVSTTTPVALKTTEASVTV